MNHWQLPTDNFLSGYPPPTFVMSPPSKSQTLPSQLPTLKTGELCPGGRRLATDHWELLGGYVKYRTCNFVHDNGYFCQSAAVGGREYCCYHLRHRGRLMRMAQARARSQSFHLDLPPLENMHAVQSALSQVVEALAADMIDPKRAQLILSALRMAANNFKNAEAWKPSAYINNHSSTYLSKYDEFEADYGLPKDVDLDAPPEVAFPPPVPAVGCPVPAGFAGAGLFPDAANISAETTSNPFEVTPQDVELNELLKTQGFSAMESRAREHAYNARRREQRKLSRANFDRYATTSKARNIQIAAEKLVAEKLMAEKTAGNKAAAEKVAAQTPQPNPPENRRSYPSPSPTAPHPRWRQKRQPKS